MNSGLQILKFVVNETKLKLNKKSEYCFTSLLHIEAISQQKEARSRDYTYSYFELFQGFFLVHSTLDIRGGQVVATSPHVATEAKYL